MNTELRRITKNDFDKDFFKLMNNSVFQKTMENVRKHRNIKLVTNDKESKNLASEPNYCTKKILGKCCGDGNEQNKCQNQPASIFWSIYSGHKHDSYV